MSTPKNLVIVESPAKAKTIEKFLGDDYRVMSSYGHIRDLKKKSFSIDVDNDFSPIYEIPDDKTQLVAELRKAAAKAETVWLASDEDREGEAIAWHLYEVLELKPENTRRIVFHEITKKAILNAIANPREIDIARVDAQQARRVLDRIVGFELSPVLWKRLKPALSAGRVQSVAVRLIVERENEIKKFKSEPYFRVTARFAPAGNTDSRTLKAELQKRLATEADARALLDSCRDASFRVGDVNVRPVKKSPAPPFTTSTLQQEAARKLGFTVSQTMMVAQRLYENGHITYMRTDSLNLSDDAIAAISAQISGTLGKEYLQVRRYHTSSKGAQEAHEAIRPTYVDRETLDDATPQEKRLYTLIRRRAIASQMADAEIEKTTVEITADSLDDIFTATGETIKFDGFLKVYIEGHDDENAELDADILPRISSGEALEYVEIDAVERFTQQPPRYTEASLVKKMEELGIGRPSTYAPTISTIQQREYVVRGEREGVRRNFSTLTLLPGEPLKAETRSETTGSEKGKLIPTDIGSIVNDFLTEYFPDILDYNFTARIEEKFDEIAGGDLRWEDEIATFYALFHPSVDKALTIKSGPKFGERRLGEDSAGEPVSVKIGRFGPVVQIGDSDSEQKPRFASLLQGQSMATITLEEALKLFEFPRALGTFEDKDVQVAIGRFGPYVRHDGKFVSIPAEYAAAELTLEQAVQLIEDKRRADANKVAKTFDEDPDLQILNGRFGVYIAYKGKNYKIPKTVAEPARLSLEECRKIIEEADAAPARKSKRSKK